jgi:hypothetical protein
MSWDETRAWQARCAICKAKSEVVFSTRRPDSDLLKDRGWGHRTLHGCGLTGYSTTDTLCPTCNAIYGDEVPDAA